MDVSQIRDIVAEVLIEEFEIEESDLNDSAKLFDDLGLDSLDYVDLIIALEKKLGLKVDRQKDEGELSEIRRVKDIIEFIQKKMQEAT